MTFVRDGDSQKALHHGMVLGKTNCLRMLVEVCQPPRLAHPKDYPEHPLSLRYSADTLPSPLADARGDELDERVVLADDSQGTVGGPD